MITATLEELEAALALKKRSRMASYYPDKGQFPRSAYTKHLAFFEAGARFRERAFIGGNRTGKTVLGAYEITCHLTGRYPVWWRGKHFNRPTKCWAAGDTSKTVKEILQSCLLGDPGQTGTGMIPGEAIIKVTARTGVAEAVDTVYVRHISGRASVLTFKSYDQRREAFQGTAQDHIWLDEECPQDIYTECLMRTMTTAGSVALTFTPLMGLTDVVLSFLPGGSPGAGEVDASKFVATVGWDDVPHLSQEAKDELLRAIPPYQRDARSKGVPQLGSGAIYPVPESGFVVPDFEIPPHWPRAYGLDVGWNRTAAVWAALDRETDTVYLYSEHYRSEAEPVVNAESVKSRGAWIPGVIDPASRGRSQADGVRLIDQYKDFGLNLEFANNAVEAGLMACWDRLSAGKIKVFASMGNWLAEFRLYRRDDKGRVVKEHDHLMDATRYLIMSGLDRAKTEPKRRPVEPEFGMATVGGWMA